MCGIAGAFNYKNSHPVSGELIRKMNEVLVHRGPDDEGFYYKDNIGLAFRRLSIIDLNTGNQPIHNEDKTIWVVFNGEIYNYVELREDLMKQGHSFYTKSDTEVIVHLYEEYGADFPLYLNGMYGIALWDEKKKTLYLVRDRAGIKPLYYAETKEGLVFASEIKSLLKGGVSRLPDHEAINQYLAYGYIPSPLTGFKSIKKLNSGHMLICSDKGCREKEFWDLRLNTYTESLQEDELVDQLIKELQSTMHRQTRSDVPLGIFLSGGIDSALIASVAVEKCNMKLDAFTVGFKEKSYNELDQAELVTNRLGIVLNKLILSEQEISSEIENILSYYDEPVMEYSAIPTFFLSKFVRSRVKTVVAGDGGDELFGGYQTHYLYKIIGLYQKLPRVIRTGIMESVNRLPESHSYLSLPYKLKRFTYGANYPYNEAHYRWKLLFDIEEKRKLLKPGFFDTFDNVEPFRPMERYFKKAIERSYSVQDQLLYVDFKTFLQEDALWKTDRMGMANSLEVRVPLLDNAIMDFSRKAFQYKVKGLKTKYLLRRALSKFQPDAIAFGKKRGFTPPLALWLKKELKEYMLSSLSEDSLSRVGFLNHSYTTKIINDHLNGRAENTRLIWALIVLVNWYRNYVNE
jgi:asparagine synthase (glutamine-hydrolysing)